MITATGLTKRYGSTLAVDGIDFTVPAGQVVGFLGPNGAGKTTTIRMITGYLAPTAGRIEIDGLDVARRSRAVRSRIGYLPEATPLYTEMRVAEYLGFRARLFGIARGRRAAAIDRAIERCWLADVRRRPIGQLSKGYRQRVGLAAALLHDPAVLVLDEPTVGLDPSQIESVRSLVRELAGDHTVLLSTHILPEVEATCDRMMIIASGRIRAAGTLDELRRTAAADNRYVVETDHAKASDAFAAVNEIERVDEIARDGAWVRYRVTANASAGDCREALARTLAKHGAIARELSREAESLERLFLRLVEAREEVAA